jgi:autotransporter passenger strand-loop-strand repeat protein
MVVRAPPDSGLASGATIFAGSQLVGSAGTALATTVRNGATEIVSSRGTTSGTILSGGGYELVSSGGTAVATRISGGTLEVAAGGTASDLVFSSGGTLQLDSGAHLGGSISGFHLGDAIDLPGLAFTSSTTLSWTQKKTSGVLTVKDGSQTQSFTLVGSYTVSNFTATADGHGGTLITDPPVISGGSVGTDASGMNQFAQKIEDGSSGSGLVTDVASGMTQVAQKIEDWNSIRGGAIDPSQSPVQWLENFVDTVVSDLEGLKTVSGFDQLLQQIENRCSAPDSGSTPSDRSDLQIPGFAAGWQSNMIQTLASFVDGKGGPPQESAIQLNDQGPQPYLAANVLHLS